MVSVVIPLPKEASTVSLRSETDPGPFLSVLPFPFRSRVLVAHSGSSIRFPRRGTGTGSGPGEGTGGDRDEIGGSFVGGGGPGKKEDVPPSTGVWVWVVFGPGGVEGFTGSGR